jgi:hypothetical protein
VRIEGLSHTAASAIFDMYFTNLLTTEIMGIRYVNLFISSCSPNCASCSDYATCTSCPIGSKVSGTFCVCDDPTYGIYNGVCTIPPMVGYYYLSSSTWTVDPLHTCLDYDTVFGYCNTCASGYYNFVGSCVTTCPSNFPAVSGVCTLRNNNLQISRTQQE